MLRLLLTPFSIFYSAIVRLRNLLYDLAILPSAPSSLPTICVGNLAVGGTGKTPHAEHLLRTLPGRKAYLSRGYRRRTKGMYVADLSSTSLDLGDEAYQIHTKFPDVTVVVDSDRHRAVNWLRQRGDIDIVILDDAFQHRNIRATKNIVLTDYASNPRRELMLPAGRLRDTFCSMRRADLIVVTKCPESLTDAQRETKMRQVRPSRTDIPVIFTSLQYGTPYDPISRVPVDLRGKNLLLFTGIEKPEPLLAQLHSITDRVQSLRYRDHHDFSSSDIRTIISHPCDLFVTTEKDFARLSSNPAHVASFGSRLVLIPIQITGDSIPEFFLKTFF